VAILTHLNTKYGVITRTDLEINCNSLRAAWNPDEEFANLWTRIKTIRHITTDGGDAISETAAMELTIGALHQAGVYSHAIQTWDDKADADQTWDNFKLHFSQQEKIRLRNMTAKATGFSPTANIIPPDDAIAAAAAPGGKPTPTSNDFPLFYCWTHGLSKNPQHPSHLCENKGEGHCDDATLENRKGGINKINFRKAGKPRE
jgi:hypothetical protein